MAQLSLAIQSTLPEAQGSRAREAGGKRDLVVCSATTLFRWKEKMDLADGQQSQLHKVRRETAP